MSQMLMCVLLTLLGMYLCNLLVFSIVFEKNKTKENSKQQQHTLFLVIRLILGSGGSYLWYSQDLWILNNAIGISVLIEALSLLNPGKMQTAITLLV